MDVIVEVYDSMNRVRPDHSLDDIHWQPSQPGQPQIIPTASGRCKRIPSAGPLTADRGSAVGLLPTSFNRQLLVQKPIRTTGGTVRIWDSTMFPAATTIAAAFFEVEPGGMLELHRHPNANDAQYYVADQARMTVFDDDATTGAFDYHRRCRLRAAEPWPLRREHGTTKRQFLELSKTGQFADISLRQLLPFYPY
jgi:oxalate decarboxylase